MLILLLNHYKEHTPLHLASLKGHIKAVKLLTNHMISNGVDINIKNKEEQTPMHCAVEGKNEEIIKFLLEKGMKINAQDERGNTPLYLASTLYRPGSFCVKELVEFLINRGADVNISGYDGQTSLRLAINSHHPPDEVLVKLILDKGAEIDKKDPHGKKVLYKAPENVLLTDVFHGDPADRIIVATTKVYGATLITRDQKILSWADQGDIRVLRA